MKKIIISLIAIVAISIGAFLSPNIAKAQINPECPNGCVSCANGCYCYDYYSYYSESSLKDKPAGPERN